MIDAKAMEIIINNWKNPIISRINRRKRWSLKISKNHYLCKSRKYYLKEFEILMSLKLRKKSSPALGILPQIDLAHSQKADSNTVKENTKDTSAW